MDVASCQEGVWSTSEKGNVKKNWEKKLPEEISV